MWYIIDKKHQKFVVTLPTDKKETIYTILLIFSFDRMNFSIPNINIPSINPTCKILISEDTEQAK